MESGTHTFNRHPMALTFLILVLSMQGLSLPIDSKPQPAQRDSTKEILDLEKELKQQAGENKSFPVTVKPKLTSDQISSGHQLVELPGSLPDHLQDDLLHMVKSVLKSDRSNKVEQDESKNTEDSDGTRLNHVSEVNSETNDGGGSITDHPAGSAKSLNNNDVNVEAVEASNNELSAVIDENKDGDYTKGSDERAGAKYLSIPPSQMLAGEPQSIPGFLAPPGAVGRPGYQPIDRHPTFQRPVFSGYRDVLPDYPRGGNRGPTAQLYDQLLEEPAAEVYNRIPQWIRPKQQSPISDFQSWSKHDSDASLVSKHARMTAD